MNSAVVNLVTHSSSNSYTQNYHMTEKFYSQIYTEEKLKTYVHTKNLDLNGSSSSTCNSQSGNRVTAEEGMNKKWYRYPPRFLKVHFTPLCFYERPTLVPVFTSLKKSEEDFRFYSKRQKVRVILYLFCSDQLQRQCLPHAWEWHSQAPSLKLHSASQHAVTIVFSCVCEHLCFLSVYFVHSLARYILE